MDFDIQAVRAQFPALHQVVGGSQQFPVFFDNPAGTQVSQKVIDAVVNYYTHMNANSGGAFSTSQRSDAMVEWARRNAADFLNAPSPDEIVFGPNMTTLMFALSRALGQTLSPGDEIVLTRMDHDANVEPWRRIAEDHGLVVRWADIVTPACTLDLDSLEAALTDKTRIVATCHASNAVGTINPVQQIADMAHAAGALYIVDAVQSAPHIPIDVQQIGCDFLLCSAYKFFGPHIGLLWGRYDLLASLPAYKVRPAKNKPPHRWETGTASFETIAGVGAALEYLAWIGREYGTAYASEFPGLDENRLHLKEGMATIRTYERELVTHLIEMLQSIDGVHIAGITHPDHLAQRVPTVVFVHDRYTPHAIAEQLAAQHIYVWDGNYYAVEIMKRLDHEAQGMVRVGLAHYNTHEEIDRLEAALRAL
ncbi:MAG: cysteine desulfurase-like protein [Anaerolineae bacterium]|nr:cysteine desulfurase-like protein [Anaerolineae bacterium]